MKQKTFTAPMQFNKQEGEEGRFVAVFATLNVKDHHGDVTTPGAFQDGQQVIIEPWNHGWNLPAGKGTIRTDDENAWVEGKFFLDTETGRENYHTVKGLSDLAEWSYTFDILEAGQGEHEGEQVQGLQASVGRPWMTANEARARLNLPSLAGDADQLVTPLNVLIGGQASPRDSAPQQRSLDAPAHPFARKQAGSHAPALRRQHEEQWTAVLTRHYRRQEAAISSRLPKAKSDIGGVWWDDARWNEELATDLYRLNALTAGAWAAQLVQQTGIDDFSEDAMLPWLEEHSRVQAENINTYTRDQVAAGLREPEPVDAVRNVFNLALTVWAVRQAVSGVTTAANFGATEAANAGGLRQKTWIVNSSNPRAEHAALAGETVGIREKFSNGMRWPGDPAGGAENNANCLCSVEFS